MKTCNCCFVEKDAESFYVLKRPNGWNATLSAYCRECTAMKQKDYRSRNKSAILERKKKYYYANIEKIKKLAAGKYKRYAGKYKAKARNYWVKTKYGLSPEQFEEIRLRQDNKCEICRIEFVTDGMKTNYGVDHCHKTGKTRSLLCKYCNSSLGQARDSIKTMESMITYLKKHGISE